MTRVARELEEENPLWIVVFGVYTRQFVGFARFDAPGQSIVVAYYPAALTSRMREIERRAKKYQKSTPCAAIASLAGADGCIHSPERKPWI
jgi:hypothetical protein